MVKDIVKKELCIVHIGMHKTGSSSIQNYLYNNLKDEGFFYPNLGSPNQSTEIYSMFSENPEKYHSFESRGMSRETVLELSENNKRLLAQKIVDSKVEKMILSGEDIINMSEDSLIKFKDFLSEYFQSIHIIGYIRPIHSYVQSAFQELVKHGLNKFNINAADPEYNRFLKFYNVFDKKNISIIPFIRENLHNRDIVYDFCKRLNIKIDTDFVSIKDNETLSKEAISLLYTYQRFTKEPYTVGSNYFVERDMVINAIKSIGHTKFSFSKKTTKEIVSNNLIALESLENISGHKFNLYESINDNNESVSVEDDLFKCSISIIDKLINIIGKNALLKKQYAKDEHEVARLMFMLKNKLLFNNDDNMGKNINTILHVEKSIASREYDIIRNFKIDWNNYYEINNLNDTSTDPVMHYINNWRVMNLRIGNVFDTQYYLNRYPDIKKANINPLIHYFRHGTKEGRQGFGANE